MKDSTASLRDPKESLGFLRIMEYVFSESQTKRQRLVLEETKTQVENWENQV